MKKCIMICLSVLFILTGCTVTSAKRDRFIKNQLQQADASIKKAEEMGPGMRVTPEYKAAKKHYSIAQNLLNTKPYGKTLTEHIENSANLKDKAAENAQKSLASIRRALKKAQGFPVSSVTVWEKSPPKADWPVAVDDNLPKHITVDDTEPKVLYKNAYNLFQDKKYDAAMKLFQLYVNSYSDSLTDNARYWIGESLYLKDNYQAALQSFNTVITKYPSSNKHADALYKIGMCHYRMDQHDFAKESFKKAIKLYPKSNAASKSRNILSLKY